MASDSVLRLSSSSPARSIASYDTGDDHSWYITFSPLTLVCWILLHSEMFLSDLAEQNSWFLLTAEELGYDREVLQEAYEFQHRGNILVKLKL